MKTIEDIEKMSAEELEQLFEDRSQDAPEGLEARIGAAVTAAAAREAWGGEAPRRAQRWLPWAVAAACAAFALAVFTPPRPKDSFDDPALAYAEVEKAFQLISEKMNQGRAIAEKAQEPVEFLTEAFNKTR